MLTSLLRTGTAELSETADPEDRDLDEAFDRLPADLGLRRHPYGALDGADEDTLVHRKLVDFGTNGQIVARMPLLEKTRDIAAQPNHDAAFLAVRFLVKTESRIHIHLLSRGLSERITEGALGKVQLVHY